MLQEVMISPGRINFEDVPKAKLKAWRDSDPDEMCRDLRI
jgi:hypothetical protein